MRIHQTPFERDAAFKESRHYIEAREYLEQFVTTLDPAAREEFGVVEQMSCARLMAECGMSEFPAVVGDEQGARVAGVKVCDRCQREYRQHPDDWRVIGYGNVPFLTILCDGRRVKL